MNLHDKPTRWLENSNGSDLDIPDQCMRNQESKKGILNLKRRQLQTAAVWKKKIFTLKTTRLS